MRCGVTGATGWLGEGIVAALQARGDEVVRFVRRPAHPGDRVFELGMQASAIELGGLDALVHCAHDFAENRPGPAWALNARGGAALLHAAAERGIARVVFISTVAAFEGAASNYGRGKIHVEGVARETGAAVLRPGLLWSERPRGLIAALTRLARLPLVPVFDGGNQTLVTAHVGDVIAAVLALIDDPARWPLAPVVAAHPQPIAIRDLVRALAPPHHSPHIVSVPSRLGLAGLAATEALGLHLPFRRDSLVSLLAPPRDLDFSHALALRLAFRPFGQRPFEVRV